VDEAGQGGFRASANEDPHGTRAVAMALPEEHRNALAAAPPGNPWFVVPPLIGYVVLLAMGLVRGDSSSTFLPALLCGGLMTAGAAGMAFRRFRMTTKSLEVINWRGHTTSVPWTDVESLTIKSNGTAVAQLRIDGKLETLKATKHASRQQLVFREPALLIPTEERELAGGARATVGGAFGALGVGIFGLAGLIAVAEHVGPNIWSGLVGGALLYLLVTAAIAYRTRLTAKRDGLHLPNRVIPWQAIEGAAPRSRSGRMEVRIYLEAEKEVTVFCGDADTAVTEILERRDVAKRMRVERET
jgi:hypothetical protein